MKELSIEEKELLLKDLCARLPYGVLVKIIDKNPTNQNNTCKLVGIDLDIGSYSLVDIHNYTIETGIEGFKPFLRPMSSMTKKEQYRYDTLEEETIYRPGVLTCLNLIDFCNAHHLDYCGLIEKGLAIETPEGMYKN